MVVLLLLGGDPTCKTKIYQLWVLFSVIVTGKHRVIWGNICSRKGIQIFCVTYDICMRILLLLFSDLNSLFFVFHNPIG